MAVKGSSMLNRVITVIAVIMVVYHILYISRLLERIGIYVPVASHRALHVTFVLLLVYLMFPGRLRWHSPLLALIAIALPVYYVLTYGDSILRRLLGDLNLFELIMGWVTIVLLLEAARRVVGLAMPVLATILILYTLYGDNLTGFFSHGSISPNLALRSLVYIGEGMFGFLTGISATIIIMFILFGSVLLVSGGGEFFTNLAYALVGRYRGGPAKMAVVASAFFAMISGSTAANVATTGSVTIPLMKRVGYAPNFAGAVEAVASNGGSITPPVMGAVAFLIAEILEIPYWSVAVAAAVPAFLYYLALYISVDIEAMRLKLAGLPPNEIPPVWGILRQGWFLIVPIGILLYFIAVLQYPPELSALYSIISLFIISMFRKKSRSPRKLAAALKLSATGGLQAYTACIVAGLIVQAVVLTGLGPKVTGLMVAASGGSLLLIALITGAACFIFGMGLSAIGIYIVVIALIAPALLKVGVEPLAAHLFVYWWGITSHITPPVAAAVFVACGISGGNVWKTGWTAVRLGLVTFIIPIIWLYKPGLLLMGTPTEILAAILVTAICIVALNFGIAGFMLRWWQRVLLTMAALLVLMPSWIPVTSGLALAAGVFSIWFLKRRRPVPVYMNGR